MGQVTNEQLANLFNPHLRRLEYERLMAWVFGGRCDGNAWDTENEWIEERTQPVRHGRKVKR